MICFLFFHIFCNQTFFLQLKIFIHIFFTIYTLHIILSYISGISAEISFYGAKFLWNLNVQHRKKYKHWLNWACIFSWKNLFNEAVAFNSGTLNATIFNTKDFKHKKICVWLYNVGYTNISSFSFFMFQVFASILSFLTFFWVEAFMLPLQHAQHNMKKSLSK